MCCKHTVSSTVCMMVWLAWSYSNSPFSLSELFRCQERGVGWLSMVHWESEDWDMCSTREKSTFSQRYGGIKFSIWCNNTYFTPIVQGDRSGNDIIWIIFHLSHRRTSTLDADIYQRLHIGLLNPSQSGLSGALVVRWALSSLTGVGELVCGTHRPVTAEEMWGHHPGHHAPCTTTRDTQFIDRSTRQRTLTHVREWKELRMMVSLWEGASFLLLILSLSQTTWLLMVTVISVYLRLSWCLRTGLASDA